MTQVVIYTTNYCPYCTAAKALLCSKKVQFDEIDVTDDPAALANIYSAPATLTFLIGGLGPSS